MKEDKRSHRLRRSQAAPYRLAPSEPKPFRSVDELLDAGLQMLLARLQYQREIKRLPLGSPEPRDTRLQTNAWGSFWHHSVNLTGDTVLFAKNLKDSRLNRTEREIVLTLALSHLGLLGERVDTCRDIADLLEDAPAKKLRVMRCLTEGSRLVQRGVIGFSDTSDSLPERKLEVDPFVLETVLDPKSSITKGWPVRSEDELYRYFARLANALESKSEAIDHCERGFGSVSTAYVWERRAYGLLKGLRHTLKMHPAWGLSQVWRTFGADKLIDESPAWNIFLALVGKELGCIRQNSSFLDGSSLALVGRCRLVNSHSGLINLLRSSYFLRSDGWIQICGGDDAFMSDDPRDLENAEFELTRKSTEILGISGRAGKKRKTHSDLATPRVRIEDLILSEKTHSAIHRAVAQAKHFRVLFDDWGLGGQIPYGRGVTMLFYGPPGTGKTAAAQGLAHELGKSILVADYSQIQNCLVGQTEKNIVRIFRDAKENDAVLFWDEADAMFFDRDNSTRNWEVRDVNVLLQEIERFEGICILATNRKATLDKALERRISMAVGFERPDRAARREIFRRMLPKSLPVADDVCVDTLAEYDLSGGEIKNVILNAARNALARSGPEARLDLSDFRSAIRELNEGRLSAGNRRPIGFARSEQSPREHKNLN